jgi:peptide-methionine (R)-S-oxide reductase
MFAMLLFALPVSSALSMPTARGATNRQCATQFTNRRTLLGGAAAAVGANIGTLPASANSKSRSDGYEVQRTDREWAYALNGQQYNILRTGGTEPPNSSPLVKEKRAGVFGCAACSNPLFESAQKFDSGTGWPSFATALPGVETEAVPAVAAALLGAELRCARCGGHLGDVFGDGFLFQGTPAAISGKRYCIDGAALVFEPADGSAAVFGAAEASKSPELPKWLQPPAVGVRVS